jgi:hypothetical protein
MLPVIVTRSGPFVLAAERAAGDRRVAELNDPAAYAELLERTRRNPIAPAPLTATIEGTRRRFNPLWVFGGLVALYLIWRWSR